MPINIDSSRPRSALLRGIRITEFKGHVINPDPVILQETDLLLEEFLSPTKLKALTGADDLGSVEFLEMIVDTSETSLGNFGIYLPNLKQLKLNGSHVPRIRDLGTSLAHLTVLWLSRSSLVDLDGVATLNNLKELYLAYNDIVDISPCSLLEKLVCLDLEGNLIDDLKQIEFLNLCPSLSNLTLYGNPICTKPCNDSPENDLDYNYRHEVIKILPSLQTLDDEATLKTKAKSPTKSLTSKSDTQSQQQQRHTNNMSCPFDDDWQLINQLLDEGIGPEEDKLAINESIRPGTSSSSSGISGSGSARMMRLKTGSIRPLTAMRPLSSYRLKTSEQMRRPISSRHSLTSSSSSRVSSSSPSHSFSSFINNDNNYPGEATGETVGSDASNLTVGPTFQGNPLKSLLARKKTNNTTSSNNNHFTIQTNQNHNLSKKNSSNPEKLLDGETSKFKETRIENVALRRELDTWRKEHAQKIAERKSYFEPQVLVIDDHQDNDNMSMSEFDQDNLIIDYDERRKKSSSSSSSKSRPKSAFKASFDYDEASVAVATNEMESLEINDSKERRKKDKSRHRSKSKSKTTSENHHSRDDSSSRVNSSETTTSATSKSESNNRPHQPIIVSNSSTSPTQSSSSMALLRSLKPNNLTTYTSSSTSSPNGLIGLRQLKTSIAPLPEINFQK